MTCQTCNDTRKVSSDAWEAPPAPCPDCTGRVPDVEARLRAQLDEANFERSTLRGGCDSLANQLLAARAEVARLEMERTALRATLIVREGLHRQAEMGERLACAERDKVRAEVARLTAENAEVLVENLRLASENTMLHGMVDWDVANACKAALAEERAANARLTAEVERLSSRLKSAEEVVVLARQLGAYSWEDRLDDSRVSDDAKQDARELGIAVWHYDQLTARLAGCKS